MTTQQPVLSLVPLPWTWRSKDRVVNCAASPLRQQRNGGAQEPGDVGFEACGGEGSGWGVGGGGGGGGGRLSVKGEGR